jgi:hypothetical protein
MEHSAWARLGGGDLLKVALGGHPVLDMTRAEEAEMWFGSGLMTLARITVFVSFMLALLSFAKPHRNPTFCIIGTALSAAGFILFLFI